MSRKKLLTIVALATLVIAGWLLVRWWVSPERKINKKGKEVYYEANRKYLERMFPDSMATHLDVLWVSGLPPAALVGLAGS